ncbi:MAG: RagB/SusD family nutrient uptake outer membrane protein [Chitinophagaceae bacterium]|nr:MAG: RagB/SusD family nutrient uptake outer membrane protein [Chitinophagaceae bacterium]
MKRIYKSIMVLSGITIGLLMATGCSKYVDKGPLDQLTDQNFWTSENNVQAFSWGFYNDIITGFGTGTNGRFYFSSFSDDQDNSTFLNFDKNAPAGDGNWSFGDIRKANLLLARINEVPISQTAKNYWAGVARFFRAWCYFRLVERFGDVPWYGVVPDISDTSLIYEPRTPRNTVMDSVLADLNFAIANLYSAADANTNVGSNTINQDCALALKSRVCLYEGTYAEYDENNNTRAAQYLQECKDASYKLITSGSYTPAADFRSTYNSESLAGAPNMILYRSYILNQVTHSTVGYTNSTTVMYGPSKSAVNSFVCKDGLPIDLSPEYKGDTSIQDVLANRDGRLPETIDSFLCYGNNRVFGMSSSTGYRPNKFLPDGVEKPGDYSTAPYNTTDAPIFWIEETMENYAEACAELDKLGQYTITQADLDISINKLRARSSVDVAPLQIYGHQGTAINGVPFVDPQKDPDVTSLIWEIRRDRRDELMMDGFRLEDLLRWHKLDYMDPQINPDVFLGAWIKSSPAGQTVNADGYLEVYPAGTTRPVQPQDYLWPIPTGEISLYPNGELTQNPGW